MQDVSSPVDANGRLVFVGSLVRVLGFSPSFHAILSRTERKRAQSMIGNTFKIDEIDKHGLAWVTKMSDVGGGRLDGIGRGLSAQEMVLVGEANAA